jgi:hypothetical protein
MVRGSLAGMAGTAVWAAAEPAVGRVLGSPWYSDVRLLGRLVTSRPVWPAIGVGMHLLNGAVFGAAFERLGGRGWKQGVAAAQVENLALWAGMAVVDRIHPDRRRGAWPRLLTNPRVIAHEVVMHAVFGAVLGVLLTDD